MSVFIAIILMGWLIASLVWLGSSAFVWLDAHATSEGFSAIALGLMAGLGVGGLWLLSALA
jgi:hypothetical protein